MAAAPNASLLRVKLPKQSTSQNQNYIAASKQSGGPETRFPPPPGRSGNGGASAAVEAEAAWPGAPEYWSATAQRSCNLHLAVKLKLLRQGKDGRPRKHYPSSA
jgi:hypothetical protein